jgi:hypothetical protein
LPLQSLYLSTVREHEQEAQECECCTGYTINPAFNALIDLLGVLRREEAGQSDMPYNRVNDNDADSGKFDPRGEVWLEECRKNAPIKDDCLRIGQIGEEAEPKRLPIGLGSRVLAPGWYQWAVSGVPQLDTKVDQVDPTQDFEPIIEPSELREQHTQAKECGT